MEEEEQICAKCGMVPEEILLLNCEHNICTQCASKTLLRESKYDERFITCEICGIKTEIDQSTSAKLQQSQQKVVYDSFIQEYENYCQEHPELKALYFCLDCETDCCCAECCIHGAHRGHEVIHIKKGNFLAKQKLKKMYQNIQEVVNQLSIVNQKLQMRRIEVTEVVAQAKMSAKESFNDLKERINKKEKELIQTGLELIDDVESELLQKQNVVQKRQQELQNVNSQLEIMQNSQSEELQLNMYAKQKNFWLEQLRNYDQEDFKISFKLKNYFKKDHILGLIENIPPLKLYVFKS